MSYIIPGIMNQPCQTFWVVKYPRKISSLTTPTRWPRGAWKWKKWTQLQNVLHNTLFFFTESLRIDHSCFSVFWMGWWLGWPVLYWVNLLLEVGSLVVLALFLVERFLLQSCSWSATGAPWWGWAPSASS